MPRKKCYSLQRRYGVLPQMGRPPGGPSLFPPRSDKPVSLSLHAGRIGTSAWPPDVRLSPIVSCRSMSERSFGGRKTTQTVLKLHAAEYKIAISGPKLLGAGQWWGRVLLPRLVFPPAHCVSVSFGLLAGFRWGGGCFADSIRSRAMQRDTA